MTDTPDAGDVVWLDFAPHAGHETAGRHPAVVLTPQAYSVTTKAKGGSFEVALRGARTVKGVALANELRSIDYAARNADKFDTGPADALEHIREIGEAVVRG